MEQISEFSPTDDENIKDNIIFGLDIGTRSVIGIVGKREGKILRILSCESEEHEKRAMTDGQIEDIDKVRKVVKRVKEKLENNLKTDLKNVSVAAAGRALKVEIAVATAQYSQKTEITDAVIDKLRNEAIDKAIEQLYTRLDEKEHNLSFYCVGNSIIRQSLDGYEFANLNEHKGNNIAIEIIATFLPSSVVESLYAVVEGNNMEISHMTLEPIASMNALIPKELRMLNLALVDIGAGTSDIAVSKAGTILSYEMVTTAGDEITEAILSALLVDFDTGERLKREISTGKSEFSYKDILMFEHTVTRDELLRIINDSVNKMCGEICETVLKVNNGPPAAVFLVGGGSQIPDLNLKIAKGLDIPENKVGLGNSPYFKEMRSDIAEIKGPEFMTPLGIVITSFSERKEKPKSVVLNGERVKIFEEKNLTVGSVLISKGISLRSLVGVTGKPIFFTVNGEPRSIRGTVSIPADIKVNGKDASVNAVCNANDVIDIVFPKNGEPPKVTIEKYFKDLKAGTVSYNGKKFEIGKIITKNGKIVLPSDIIKNDDAFEIKKISALSDLSPILSKKEKEVYLVNGKKAGANFPLMNGDVISVCVMDNIKENKNCKKGLKVYINGKECILEPNEDGSPFIFAQALNFVDFDLSHPDGIPILTLNGRSTGYSEVIHQNDEIEIKIVKE